MKTLASLTTQLVQRGWSKVGLGKDGIYRTPTNANYWMVAETSPEMPCAKTAFLSLCRADTPNHELTFVFEGRELVRTYISERHRGTAVAEWLKWPADLDEALQSLAVVARLHGRLLVKCGGTAVVALTQLAEILPPGLIAPEED